MNNVHFQYASDLQIWFLQACSFVDLSGLKNSVRISYTTTSTSRSLEGK